MAQHPPSYTQFRGKRTKIQTHAALASEGSHGRAANGATGLGLDSGPVGKDILRSWASPYTIGVDAVGLILRLAIARQVATERG
jgi:hypothetical protein